MNTELSAHERMESWLLSHPKLLKMQSYGLGNSSQLEAALFTYLDLTEVKLWSEVREQPCPALRTIYLTARQREEGPLCLVVPLSSSHPLSMEHLASLHSATRESELERGLEEQEFEDGLTVALVGGDSTILYCHMWPNIHLSPTSPP